MDAIKKRRKAQRTAFTRAHTAFMSKIESDSAVEEKLIAFQFLESKMTDLDVAHDAFNQALYESSMADADIEREVESCDAYKTQYLTAKMKVMSLSSPVSRNDSNVSVNFPQKTLKLPPIELPQFHGNIKEWLPFWSQFKKIHENPNLSNEDKFQYLIQTTVPGTRASDLVNSFPPTGENYGKVITSMKTRFGRDDIVVEFYVRELLGLVLQNANKGNKMTLAGVYDKVESYIRALETLGVTTDKCAAMLYPLVESSLPEEVLRAWQRSDQHRTAGVGGAAAAAAAGDERVNLDRAKDKLTGLLEFLQQEVENEERIEMAMQGFAVQTEPEKHRKYKVKNETTKEVATASALFVAKDTKPSACVFCKLAHESHDCVSARKLSLNERKDIVKKENACFYCLKRGHIAKRCKVRIKCEWCSRRHLLVMCPAVSTKENFNTVEKNNTENNLAACGEAPTVRLQTLRVALYSDTHEKIVRVLIDPGSERSYVRTDIIKELGYASKGKQEVIHSLFGGVKTDSETHDRFLVRMRNLENTYACNFSVMNKNSICDTVPSIKNDKWVDKLRSKNIRLSDIDNKTNTTIDVLIGADVAGKLMTGKKYDLENGLIAFETRLGWTVMGENSEQSMNHDTTTMITTMFVQEANVSELWHLDVLGITDPIESLNKSLKEKQAREFIIQNVELNTEGRYEVRLPFLENHACVADNYDISRNRLSKMVDKLKGQNLFNAYDEIFKEWESDGVIERVVDNEVNDLCHYLPHRPVIKARGTTKIRPVYDASACKKGFPSLNQCLEKGPNLIELVPSSLNRFREFTIGVVADIKKAFLQISVNKLDRNFLRFLWIVDDRIVVFRHCRVVFGLACSPFLLAAIIDLLLTTALEQAKKAEKCKWSTNTVEKLKDSFYVDNCVASVNSVEEIQTFKREAEAVMSVGGFELRGWECSNDTSENRKTLVLGILWNKEKDTLSINPDVLNIDYTEVVTKRRILSAANRIFDPIGFTCPVSLLPKLLLQELWAEEKQWDAAINDGRSEAFKQWVSDLRALKQIEISRKLGTGNLTIHTFCDASGTAYAAAVFARVEDGQKVSVQLLGARSRIAPKKATIPRLELMAATIAVRLTKSILSSLRRKVLQITYWSDSTTVLAWIERDLQWGMFVRNRINEIRSFTEQSSWRYVPSELNPADLPSRGCTSSQLVESQWWLGPKWLYEADFKWPAVRKKVNESEVSAEIKKSFLNQMVNMNNANFKAGKHFSTYSKVIRFLAWMNRFINNCRKRIHEQKKSKGIEGISKKSPQTKNMCTEKREELSLTFAEIKAAETKLLKFLQMEMFNSSNKNKLSSFKTMLNEEGLYVLKTKIFNRIDDVNFLCPILLDNNHDIVYLLVRETHEKLGHVGCQIMLSNLRERFWIISLRSIAKSVISRCIVCKKQKAKSMQCEVPPLPLNRVRDALVFEVVGVDFAGPLFLKGGGKGWICIFTCAVYRAVHLELASSLSTDEFLQCLRRFIARRGRPRIMYSDNGTNFAGAHNAFNALNWTTIAKHSSASQIEWHFNPPSAPWWGGWWERLIGVLKSILRKILGKANLSFENLLTILCDAEAIVNSRPLTYISEDPEDLRPLTPLSFLCEIQEFGTPDCDMFYHNKLNNKLKCKQQVLEAFRARFRTEYLGQLVLKNKKPETRKIEVGDVVLIGDDNRKRIDWPLARVVDVILGKDGIARVFVLKTKNGTLKRPIQRIYPLEITQKDAEIAKTLREKTKLKKIKYDPSGMTDKPNSANKKGTSDVETKNCEPKVVTTRSGRVIKKPVRFTNF